MPRALRLESENASYHVINRGNYTALHFRSVKTKIETEVAPTVGMESAHREMGLPAFKGISDALRAGEGAA